MKELTKAEEEVMQILWDLERAFVKEILAEFPKPKPAYNTVSTIVRILEQKGFVDHEAFGKTHQYYPKVSREEYSKATAEKFASKYFNGSFKQMVSFFVKEKQIDTKELDALLKEIEKRKDD